jgi:hypothetical protein
MLDLSQFSGQTENTPQSFSRAFRKLPAQVFRSFADGKKSDERMNRSFSKTSENNE